MNIKQANLFFLRFKFKRKTNFIFKTKKQKFKRTFCCKFAYLLAKLPPPEDSEMVYRSSSQAATCCLSNHLKIPLVAPCRKTKQWRRTIGAPNFWIEFYLIKLNKEEAIGFHSWSGYPTPYPNRPVSTFFFLLYYCIDKKSLVKTWDFESLRLTLSFCNAKRMLL